MPNIHREKFLNGCRLCRKHGFQSSVDRPKKGEIFLDTTPLFCENSRSSIAIGCGEPKKAMERRLTPNIQQYLSTSRWRTIMSTTTKTKLATRALAFAGALSLFAATTAFSAVVADGTPFSPGVALTGTANFGGIALLDTTTPFSENFNLPPNFTGTLRTVVVRNGGGTLDFYYQLGNIATPLPPADIFRFTIDGFDPFATGVMDYSTNGLAGIAGAGAFVIGNAPPTTADRDPSLGSGVGFTFGVASAPLGPIGTPGNLEVGDTSFFMIVRTNASDYTSVEALVSGFGTAVVQSAGPSATPIPEPGSALIGMAVMGLCGSGLVRRNRKTGSV
jgi:hypothetical protein